ncbi:hypothetical protein NBH00_20505 [Paraconexibacter antarcticus]|uniref:Uncharacterized protein n=1 Tax=Paraconexibacter antarcticus TaxID=2949664 RepID=A0ABY5DRK8_9ACTN|nr:hypothetical protein [Paraconexibacter antarcticus]UTI63712.1 hypothetical protein NBH00_20505 [Paraconexibacter antarcticus]
MRPLEQLIQWEDAGAGWRVAALGPDAAVVDLLACTGEPVDVLRSDDPELLAYLGARRSSEEDPPAGG